ncbi:hypothetical protein D3P07_19070 [Paenibacillus sp. 1011MAR3C5]|nr:hypothetical protein D3P07_19070 [Paenibacillus sp. 1011MAR3C5]
MMIDEGQIIYDGGLQSFSRQYGGGTLLEVEYRGNDTIVEDAVSKLWHIQANSSCTNSTEATSRWAKPSAWLRGSTISAICA